MRMPLPTPPYGAAKLHRTLVLCLLAALPGLGRAQDASLPPTSVLHVNTRLVVLDVVVTGKDGKLVPGLTKNDFHILEDEDPQTIRSLQYTASVADPASRAKSVLILDELNNSIEESNYSKAELNHYISTLPEILLQPTMLVAVDDQGLRELVSFTRDRQALEHALHGESSHIPSDFLRRDYQARFRTTLNTLWQIGHSAEGSAGRTELIWVGHGFPSLNLDNVEGDYVGAMQTLVQNVCNALLNARAVLYRIDPAPVGAGNMTASIDSFDTAFDDSVEPFADSISFDSLVSQTGGHAFFNRNDVDAEVKSAVSLGGTFYTLTYTPTHPTDSPTPYRHIHLTVDRPDTHAATRLGYFTAQVETTAAPDPNTVVDAAIASGIDYTGLKIAVVGCTPDAAAAATHCKLQIDTKDLSWTSAADSSSTITLLVAAASYSATHKPTSYTRSPVTLHATAAERLPAQATFDITLHVPTGASSLRFVVLVKPCGKLGSTNTASRP